MGHLAKPRDASFFRVFFNPYHYGVLTIIAIAIFIHFKTAIDIWYNAIYEVQYKSWTKLDN